MPTGEMHGDTTARYPNWTFGGFVPREPLRCAKWKLRKKIKL